MKLAATGAAASFSAAPLRGLAREAYPPDVDSKFYADGRVHPFPGNTIICHLPQQGEHAEAFNALLDIYREAPTRPFIRKVAVLPPSSFHMTVFGGANDKPRKSTTWPANLPFDMPIEACNRALFDRLRNFHLGFSLPIRMKVDPEQDPVNGAPLIFRLVPVDSAEATKLRGLRDRLAEVTQIHAADHDHYQFHVSFGYSLAWLTEAENQDLQTTWRRWAGEIARKAPVIELGAPEYCVFDDMYAFHRLLYLGQRG